MFNRVIETKVVKKSKTPKTEDTVTPTVTVDYAQLVLQTTERIGATVVVSVGAYVLLDTVRQVLVKIAPQH